MNTMPCIVPGLNAMGVKIVTRYPERTKTINGEILLYDYHTGKLLALMDAFLGHKRPYRSSSRPRPSNIRQTGFPDNFPDGAGKHGPRHHGMHSGVIS